MTFDARAYWSSPVPDLTADRQLPPTTPEHVEQVRVLHEMLRGLEFGSALEVGCGLGRITRLLATMTDDVTAIDIGADQVATTQRNVPTAVVMQAAIQDFEPDRTWDLVLASEVLLHIPPGEIQAVCDKLRRLANRWIVTVDWTTPVEGPIAEWNWLHDYRSLFGTVEGEVKTGLQSVFLIRP